jgi:hypothetical protein
MRGKEGASIKRSEKYIAGQQSRLDYPFRHSTPLCYLKRTALAPAAGV